MISIDRYQQTDFETIRSFVEAIQEHERLNVPELKTGAEIGEEYALQLLDKTNKQAGIILIASEADLAVGFICAWLEEDDDILLRDDARSHAYVSDLYVRENSRRQGIARLLLETVEEEMQKRGCKRIKICSKSSNAEAISCYEANGFQAYETILTKPI